MAPDVSIDRVACFVTDSRSAHGAVREAWERVQRARTALKSAQGDADRYNESSAHAWEAPLGKNGHKSRLTLDERVKKRTRAYADAVTAAERALESAEAIHANLQERWGLAARLKARALEYCRSHDIAVPSHLLED